jgi:hypothetical protein
VTDEPTLAELRRRVDETRTEMRSSFKSLGERLDKLPTGNELTLQFQSAQSQLDLVMREVARVESAGNKRMDDIEDDQETYANRLEANRKWLVSIAMTGAGVLIGLGGFIFSVVAK